MCPFFLASQLMNQQSIKSLQVALACQLAQKNALMSAVKLACVCRWAESETSAAEVGLTDPTAAFHTTLKASASWSLMTALLFHPRRIAHLPENYSVSVVRFGPKYKHKTTVFLLTCL